MNPMQALGYFASHNPVMEIASSEQRSRLLNSMIVEKIDSEQTVFSAKSTVDYLYFLSEGEIGLSRNAAKSVDATVNSKLIIHSGQYFSLQAVIPAQHHRYFATALQPSIIIKIPVKNLQVLLIENKLIMNYFLQLLALQDTPHHVQDNRAYQANNTSDCYSLNNIYKWLSALALPTILYTTLQFFTINQSSTLFFSTLLFGLLAWTLNLMPPYGASIFMLLSFLATGIVPPSVALSGFATDSIIILFCLYALGGGILTSGLAHRLLLIALQYLPSSQWWMNIYVLITGGFITALIPGSTERQKFSVPILADLINFTKIKFGSAAAKQLIISSFTGSTLLSSLFYHGSIYNFILLSLLISQDQERFTWGGWFEAVLVPGAIMLVVQTIIITMRCFHLPKLELDGPRINMQKIAYGSLTLQEWIVICAIVFLIVGLSTINFHRMTALTIYLLMFTILIFTDVINHKPIYERISWAPLLLFASLTGIVASAQYLKITDDAAVHLNWLGIYIKNNFSLFIMVLSLFSALIRLFLPYGPTVIILASVLIPIAQAQEVNGWLMSFICLTTAKIWFFTYQNSVFQNLMTPKPVVVQFDERNILFYNIIVNAGLVLMLIVSQYYWKRLGLL